MAPAVVGPLDHRFDIIPPALGDFLYRRQLTGRILRQDVVHQLLKIIKGMLNTGASLLGVCFPGISDNAFGRTDAFHSDAAERVVPLDGSDAVFRRVVDVARLSVYFDHPVLKKIREKEAFGVRL